MREGALRALTRSALALPGLVAPAAADTPVGGISAHYQTAYYVEDELDSSKVTPGGETERFEVEMHQLSLGAPLGDRFELDLDIVHESMSGASPWYVVPDADGDPIQVMTGATIRDERTDALLGGTWYLDAGRFSLRGGLSTENDYFAWNGGFETERHFNEKNTTITGGGGFSIDTLEPTDADLFPTRPDEEDKQSYSVFAGISQVVSRQSAIQSTLSFQHARGFLSDPYKQAFVAGEPRADSRPDSRNQLSWLTRYRHHFSEVEGSLHADYRFYVDDWSVRSHTLELAWYQSLWDAVRLIPSFRYYTQSQADFYAPYFAEFTSDGLHSSDYRLSPYGALSWKLRAETRMFETWRLRWNAELSWERYMSSEDFALGSVSTANPGLVSFNVFSIGLKARF